MSHVAKETASPGTAPTATPAVKPVIVTRLFKMTFGVTFVAYFVAYLPFTIKFFEELLQTGCPLIQAYADNIDDLFVAGLAVSIAAFLTYYESEKEKLAGNNCSGFAFANVVTVIFCLIGFFLSRNEANHLELKIVLSTTLAGASMFANLMTLIFAFLTVLQIRRAKDGYT